MINAFVHNLWIDGNAPMFTGFNDRIEILSRGHLPPKQTVEGFFAGESVPVNKKLSDIFLQLHISERSGRGVPKIMEIYRKDRIDLRKNSIIVTIPFNKLSAEVYASNSPKGNAPVDAPVDVPDHNDKAALLLKYCQEPKTTLEIADYLGYKDKRSVRKYLNILLSQGRIAMTIPDKPNSRYQKYVTIQ